MDPETVKLPFDVAENLLQLLTSVYYQNQAMDLVEGYRSLRSQHKLTPLTKRLHSEIEILQSWIDIAKKDLEEVDDDDEDGDAESA